MAAVLVALAVGCTGGGDPPPAAEPTPSTLAELGGVGGAADVAVPRLEFCELVPDEAVAAALGARPQQQGRRTPGDVLAGPAGPQVADQPLQEVACDWSAGDVTAAAWVFAEPVDARRAERLVEAAAERDGCTATGAAYGDPGVRQDCGDRVRHAGLLGDTWLTCELRGPDAAERAEAWCVALLTSLDPDA